jgi:hypothetical protein
VQLWSAPVNIRAHNLKITAIGDILEFGWVNIITASERQWIYGNGHVVRECVTHLPTWDTAGIGPWYQEVYWSTARAVGDCERVEEGEEVDQVFFNDRPWTPPYEDLYEHNGVPLGRLHYCSPQRLDDHYKLFAARTSTSRVWLSRMTGTIGQYPGMSAGKLIFRQTLLPRSVNLFE